jgi:hypothetical protein
MRFKTFLIYFVLLSSGLLQADETTKSLQETFYLQQELELTKSPAFYFIFDLSGKKIDLKARSFVLREWKIQEVRVWGRPVPWNALRLLKKSSLVAPQRRKIVPGSVTEPQKPASPKPPAANKDKKGEKATEEPFELEALELRHMPRSFTLWMEEGIGVDIRAREKGFSNSLRSVLNSAKWLVIYPLRTLFSYKKRPFTSITITLDNINEAQALYWALLEGQVGLIKAVPAS